MPVKIRLMRIGAKKRPFYRVVAVDEQRKRTGQYIELLGTYNPLTEPHEVILKKDRIEYWLKQGAVPSDGYLRVIKEAPQKPPRKPKKEPEVKPEAAPAAPVVEASEPTEEVAEPAQEAPEVTEQPQEEQPVAETPAENTEAAAETEEKTEE